MKKRVLQVPRRFVRQEWGGTETVILESSRELKKLGYDVDIYTSMALSEIEHEEILGVSVRRFPHFYPRLGLATGARHQLDMRGGNLFSISFWKALFQARDVSAIHLHTTGFLGAMVRLVARRRHIPYFVTIHGGALDLSKEQLQQFAEPTKGSFNWGKILEVGLRSGRVLQDATAVICVCESERALLAQKYPAISVIYLPNGVDIHRFSQGNADRFLRRFELQGSDIVLSVGGFYPQKNQRTLVQAFADLAAKNDKVVLVLVGVTYDDAYYQGLKEECVARKIADRVRLLPNVPFDDEVLADAYAAAKVFVFPSTYETFGIVVLEAWSAGKPVICGKVGGLVSFVRDGENGLFCDIHSPVDIREKIERVLADAPLKERLVQQGLHDVKEYTWAKMGEKLVQIYESK